MIVGSPEYVDCEFDGEVPDGFEVAIKSWDPEHFAAVIVEPEGAELILSSANTNNGIVNLGMRPGDKAHNLDLFTRRKLHPALVLLQRVGYESAIRYGAVVEPNPTRKRLSDTAFCFGHILTSDFRLNPSVKTVMARAEKALLEFGASEPYIAPFKYVPLAGETYDGSMASVYYPLFWRLGLLPAGSPHSKRSEHDAQTHGLGEPLTTEALMAGFKEASLRIFPDYSSTSTLAEYVQFKKGARGGYKNTVHPIDNFGTVFDRFSQSAVFHLRARKELDLDKDFFIGKVLGIKNGLSIDIDVKGVAWEMQQRWQAFEDMGQSIVAAAQKELTSTH